MTRPNRVRLYTETGSVHELDLKAGTYTRLRRGHASGTLRRDGEPIAMLTASYAVGISGVFTLQLREDGVKTVRQTSPIVRVEEI